MIKKAEKRVIEFDYEMNPGTASDVGDVDDNEGHQWIHTDSNND